MPAIHLKLHLSDDILAEYEKLGPLDKVLSEHLTKTVKFRSAKPLYIDDVMRQRLERFFGKNFDSPLELIKLIEKYATIRLGEINMQIPPSLLSRLRTRHFNINETFEQFLVKQITKSLEEFVGAR